MCIKHVYVEKESTVSKKGCYCTGPAELPEIDERVAATLLEASQFSSFRKDSKHGNFAKFVALKHSPLGPGTSRVLQGRAGIQMGLDWHWHPARPSPRPPSQGCCPHHPPHLPLLRACKKSAHRPVQAKPKQTLRRFRARYRIWSLCCVLLHASYRGPAGKCL